jgi:hypothetical protein
MALNENGTARTGRVEGLEGPCDVRRNDIGPFMGKVRTGPMNGPGLE